MDLQKISKSGSLAYLRVLQAQKQCNKFQNFDVSTKKVTVTQKCNHDSCLPLVLSIFNLPCQLWRVIIFEFLSVCAEIVHNLISYIPFIWESFIRIRNGSCPNLWKFDPFDMEWPYRNFYHRIFSSKTNKTFVKT